jgi:hypothetical protein
LYDLGMRKSSSISNERTPPCARYASRLRPPSTALTSGKSFSFCGSWMITAPPIVMSCTVALNQGRLRVT